MTQSIHLLGTVDGWDSRSILEYQTSNCFITNILLILECSNLVYSLNPSIEIEYASNDIHTPTLDQLANQLIDCDRQPFDMAITSIRQSSRELGMGMGCMGMGVWVWGVYGYGWQCMGMGVWVWVWLYGWGLGWGAWISWGYGYGYGFVRYHCFFHREIYWLADGLRTRRLRRGYEVAIDARLWVDIPGKYQIY